MYSPNDPKPKAIGGLYTVRLTVEGMKHAIEQCLIDHDGSLRATVEAELGKAVEQFDFKGEVKKVCELAIRDAVKRAIEGAVRDSFSNPALIGGLNKLVMDQLYLLISERS